jgi:hypothetical protein
MTQSNRTVDPFCNGVPSANVVFESDSKMTQPNAIQQQTASLDFFTELVRGVQLTVLTSVVSVGPHFHYW